jgi:hypothetical protein
MYRLAVAECLGFFTLDIGSILDWRWPWSLVWRVLGWHRRRRALAAHEQFVLLLLGFHLVHTSQTALHTLDVVVDIWGTIDRTIVIIVAHAAAPSIGSL